MTILCCTSYRNTWDRVTHRHTHINDQHKADSQHLPSDVQYPTPRSSMWTWTHGYMDMSLSYVRHVSVGRTALKMEHDENSHTLTHSRVRRTHETQHSLALSHTVRSPLKIVLLAIIRVKRGHTHTHIKDKKWSPLDKPMQEAAARRGAKEKRKMQAVVNGAEATELASGEMVAVGSLSCSWSRVRAPRELPAFRACLRSPRERGCRTGGHSANAGLR